MPCAFPDMPALVSVPRNDMPLAPVAPDRVQRLREHLVQALGEARVLRSTPSPYAPQPTGFAALVAQTACSLCKGWCCRNGGDDAFVDDRTMARVRRDRPALGMNALLRLYTDRVPAMAFAGSCIFHAGSGCTLDPSLRADICNSYFCRGLGAYLTDRKTDTPRIVVAGKGAGTRTSAVMVPSKIRGGSARLPTGKGAQRIMFREEAV